MRKHRLERSEIPRLRGNPRQQPWPAGPRSGATLCCQPPELPEPPSWAPPCPPSFCPQLSPDCPEPIASSSTLWVPIRPRLESRASSRWPHPRLLSHWCPLCLPLSPAPFRVVDPKQQERPSVLIIYHFSPQKGFLPRSSLSSTDIHNKVLQKSSQVPAASSCLTVWLLNGPYAFFLPSNQISRLLYSAYAYIFSTSSVLSLSHLH